MENEVIEDDVEEMKEKLPNLAKRMNPEHNLVDEQRLARTLFCLLN